MSFFSLIFYQYNIIENWQLCFFKLFVDNWLRDSYEYALGVYSIVRNENLKSMKWIKWVFFYVSFYWNKNLKFIFTVSIYSIHNTIIL